MIVATPYSAADAWRGAALRSAIPLGDEEV